MRCTEQYDFCTSNTFTFTYCCYVSVVFLISDCVHQWLCVTIVFMYSNEKLVIAVSDYYDIKVVLYSYTGNIIFLVFCKQFD